MLQDLRNVCLLVRFKIAENGLILRDENNKNERLQRVGTAVTAMEAKQSNAGKGVTLQDEKGTYYLRTRRNPF